MDKSLLESKKTWLESELAKLNEELSNLTVKSHRFSGALGFVNDLIKELGDGEPAQKEASDNGRPKPTKTIRPKRVTIGQRKNPLIL
jgi:hypothetical protein